jgi:hypothetical protein
MPRNSIGLITAAIFSVTILSCSLLYDRTQDGLSSSSSSSSINGSSSSLPQNQIVAFNDNFESYAFGSNPTLVYYFYGSGASQTLPDNWVIVSNNGSQMLQFAYNANVHYDGGWEFYKTLFSHISNISIEFYSTTQHGWPLIYIDCQQKNWSNCYQINGSQSGIGVDVYIVNNGIGQGITNIDFATDKTTLTQSCRFEVYRIGNDIKVIITRLDNSNSYQVYISNQNYFNGSGYAGFGGQDDYPGGECLTFDNLTIIGMTN